MARVQIHYNKVHTANESLHRTESTVSGCADSLAQLRRALPGEVGARYQIAQSLLQAQQEIEDIAAGIKKVRTAAEDGCSRYEQTEIQLKRATETLRL